MKHKIQWLLTILMLLSLVLAACSPAAPAEAPAEPAEAEEAPAEEVEEVAEPVEEAEEEAAPAEEEMAEEGDLAGNFAAFLANMEAYNTLSPEALNTMIAEGAEFFLLDVRGPSEAEEKGYIEGAVQIPLHDLGKNTDKLPPVDEMVVVYCAAGTRAALGGAALGALGYTDVKVLTGGSFGGWLEAGYPIAEGIPAEGESYDVGFAANLVEAVDMALTGINDIGYGQITAENLQTALVENPDMVLIDARRADEVEGKGYIPADNWVHIALEDFVANMDQWPADMDADIAVYCGSGYRSNLAMTILRTFGYTNVTSLKGGFGGWATAGFPVEGAPITVSSNYSGYFAAMSSWNTISPEALNTLIAEGQEVFILDVRGASEAEELGHIEGAVQIPLQDLGKHTDLLPSLDTPIVTYCKAGTRAVIGATMLGALGYTDVKALTGNSFGGWLEAGYPVAEGVPAEGEAYNVEFADGLVEAVDLATTGLNEVGWMQTSVDNAATAIVENPDLIVIDVRTPGEVVGGVIDAPNFIHLNLVEMIDNMNMWPEDKEADILIYCKAGTRGNIALAVMRAHGYVNAVNMGGGYGAYVEAGYPTMDYMPPVDLDTPYGAYLGAMESWNTTSPEALNTMIAEGEEFFLLDVRTPAEAEELGYIEGAVQIPLQDLGKHTDLLPSLDTPIVTYCKAGTRAVIGATMLGALGYTDVKALTGNSFGGWLEAGYPVATGVPAEGEVIGTAFDPIAVAAVDKALTGLNEMGWKQTSVDNAATAIVENPDLIVIDVRTPEEVAEGVIDAPNLVHISLLDMVAMKDMWPADKEADILIYCKAGTRGNIALSILRANGYYNAVNMAGGYGAWVEAGYPVAEYAME